MKSLDPEPGAGDLFSLWTMLEQLEEGTLSVSECEELDALLGESAEARSIYLEYFELATLIEGQAAIRAEEGGLPVLPVSRNEKKVFRLSILAAAAVLALMAGIGAYVTVSQSRPAVASMEVIIGTEWMVDGVWQAPDSEGASIGKGSAIKVSSGVVALTLKSGVRLVLQGPMDVSFPTMDYPALRSGWLWIDSGALEEPFQVDTPELYIRDIGTRFGVRVRPDGLSEVHLQSGLVEAESRHTGRIIKLGPGARGAMIPALGEVEELLLATDPFLGIQRLVELPRGYPTTILSQSPSGYWDLNDEEHGVLRNLVEGGTEGVHGPSVQANEPGLRPEDGFGGLGSNNRGVFLTGVDKESVLVNLDIPGGVSRKAGGVSFWFRRDTLPSEEEMLWYAGRTGGGLGPDDEMHAYLGPEGRVRFFMENGKYDILLSSGRSVTDGLWHHVAASWGKNAVELFLDGKRVGRDAEPRSMSGDVFFGYDVRFGKSRSNHVRRFQGWVDEIALWNRPLTLKEVEKQYQAARQAPDADE